MFQILAVVTLDPHVGTKTLLIEISILLGFMQEFHSLQIFLQAACSQISATCNSCNSGLAIKVIFYPQFYPDMFQTI